MQQPPLSPSSQSNTPQVQGNPHAPASDPSLVSHHSNHPHNNNHNNKPPQQHSKHGNAENKALLKLSPGRRSSPLRRLLMAVLLSVFVLCMMSYILGVHYLGLDHWFLFMDRPLPVFILMLLVPIYGEYNKKTITYVVWIEIGLLFCLVADVILLFNNRETNHLMTYGLSANMLGKICYTVAFTVGVGKEFKLKLLLCVPYYAFGGLILFLVYPKILNQFIYFLIYVFFECTMGWRALTLTSEFPGSDRTKLLLWFSAVGAALFIASDTLIILNEFYMPLNGEVYYASLIYWLAQLFIAFSVPRRLTKSDYWLDQLAYINPFVKK